MNHLLRHADGLRLAVLVNEFGALPIDADLIEAQDETVIAIAGGCVCCSYGNDLTLALMDMARADPAPDHVILEASGVALPGAIAASVSLLQGYALDGIVTLCDAETVRERAADPYMGDTVARQISDADLLVLNKTDLVSTDERAAVEDWLRAGGEGAEIVTAVHGAVPPEALMRSVVGRRRAPAVAHDMPLHTLSIAMDRPVDAQALARALADPAAGLVRAKGFVTGADGEACILQIVGRRWEVTPAPAPAATDAPRAVVLIGVATRMDEAALRRRIDGCAA